jgi:hypothetical protein
MVQKLMKRRSKKPGKIFLGTTMGKLFTVIQNEVSLSEDNIVVEVATHLFHTGQVKYAT